MDRTILLLDSPIRVQLGFAYGLFDFPDIFDDDLAFVGIHGENSSLLPLVVTGDDFDFVAWIHVCFDFHV